MNRLQTSVACVLWAILSSASAECQQGFQLKNKFVTREQLLEDYAPSVLHWHKQHEDKDKWSFLDLLMTIDFDGDRETEGNRRKAQELSREGRAYSLEPVFYADIVAATKTHLFLLYYFFHAADLGDSLFARMAAWFPLGWGAHENDLEGGILVIERDTGRVIAASFLAHNGFDDREIERDIKFRHGDGRCDWVVWVEGGKHGSHLILKDRLSSPEKEVWGASGFSDRDHFLKYKGVANGHSPRQEVYLKQRLSEGEWDGIHATRARILPLWPWFAQMYQGEGPELVQSSPIYRNLLRPEDIRLRFARNVGLGIYRSMAGAEGNKATFPWGQNLERFFDPAEAFSHRFKRRVDCSYVYNPYLQSLLARKLVTPDGSGGPAFPPEWNERRQGACAP